MTSTPKFKFRCSYQCSVWYDVWDSNGHGELECRRDAYSYEEAHYNGSREEYQRDVIGAINLLIPATSYRGPIPRETLEAFNAWRQAEHEAHKQRILSQPERYGVCNASDPIFSPPAVAKAAHYEQGKGWVVESYCLEGAL